MTTRPGVTETHACASHRERLRRFLVAALLAWPLAGPAQTVDPVEPFLGTWSGVFTTQDHEYWTFADLQCFVGCALDYYNHLSALRHRLRRAWSSLDALARERHDELTKLLDLCAKPLDSERNAFARLDEARTAVLGARNTQDPEALGRAEGRLREQLAALLALASRSPALTAAPGFAQIRNRLAVLDAQIVQRREDYNAVVLENNIAIDQFPQRVVAGIAGLRPMALLEFTAGADAQPRTPR